MKEHAIQADCIGPRACFRSPIRGICCACDRWTNPMPAPINRAGVFCGTCCPCCNGPQSSGNGHGFAPSAGAMSRGRRRTSGDRPDSAPGGASHLRIGAVAVRYLDGAGVPMRYNDTRSVTSDTKPGAMIPSPWACSPRWRFTRRRVRDWMPNKWVGAPRESRGRSGKRRC